MNNITVVDYNNNDSDKAHNQVSHIIIIWDLIELNWVIPLYIFLFYDKEIHVIASEEKLEIIWWRHRILFIVYRLERKLVKMKI